MTELKSKIWTNMIAIHPCGDSSSFLNSVLNAFSIPYRRLFPDIRAMQSMVRDLRYDLALKLGEMKETPNQTWYNFYFENRKDMTIDAMKAALRSYEFIGHELREFISDVLGYDIYILLPDDHVLGVEDPAAPHLYKKRPSIVLYYRKEAQIYDLVGIKTDTDGAPLTVFSHDHPFIQSLYKKATDVQTR